MIANTLDNNPSTIWHSDWHDSSITLPIEVVFTFDTPTEVARFDYLPRQNGINGNITKFDLYITDENNIESKIIENYTWTGDSSLKTVKFDSKTIKSVRMVITGSHGDTVNKFASAAEFSFFASVDEENNEVDRTALMELITTVNQLDESDYTASSFDQEVMDDLLSKADEVINNEAAGEDDLFEICNQIQEFLNGLVECGNVNELDALVKDYSSLVENEYTVDSWNVYKQVLDNAIAIIADNSNSSQADVDRVKDQLINAKEKLVRKEETTVNKTALSIVIEMAESVSLENVVPAVVEEFNAALENAQTVNLNASATQAEVDNAFTRLANAMHMLEFFKGNKELLQKLVDQINSLVEEQYIPSTWSTMLPALQEANGVLADENVMQEEVDEVYTELVRAFINLRLKPNKDLLAGLINKVNELNSASYTAKTWAAVTNEVLSAKAVLNNPEATREEVETVVSALTKALAGLEARLVETVKSGDTTVSVKTGDDSVIGATAGLTVLGLIGLLFSRKKTRKG